LFLQLRSTINNQTSYQSYWNLKIVYQFIEFFCLDLQKDHLPGIQTRKERIAFHENCLRQMQDGRVTCPRRVRIKPDTTCVPVIM